MEFCSVINQIWNFLSRRLQGEMNDEESSTVRDDDEESWEKFSLGVFVVSRVGDWVKLFFELSDEAHPHQHTGLACFIFQYYICE